MEQDFSFAEVTFRELARYLMPRRYRWLDTRKDQESKGTAQERHILDATGSKAARIEAAGLMSGITSPARPWLRMKVVGGSFEQGSPVSIWLEDVSNTLLQLMAQSNLYEALAIMYLDLVVFGTSGMLIYEDDKEVFRCFNSALGEFFIGQDSSGRVNAFGRRYNYTVAQTVQEFGLENCSDAVKAHWESKGSLWDSNVRIGHLIEENVGMDTPVPKRFPFREVYFDYGDKTQRVLAVSGLHEFNAICPRWETVGNDPWGNSPGMSALGDIIQLQQETLRKGQSLDMLVRPPMIADSSLRNSPSNLIPGGVTYVPNLNSSVGQGFRPAYQVNAPLGEISADIQDIRQRIMSHFDNELFSQFANLQTVRSATEIDARVQEKLLLLGPALDRIHNEGLDRVVERVYGIALRAGLLPEPPEELGERALEIQYTSVLADAQRAIGTASVEQMMAFTGNLAQIFPEALDNINVDGVMGEMATALSVPGRVMNTPEARDAKRQANAEQAALQEAAQIGSVAVQGAKGLSETEVGGGGNALEQILGAV